MNTLTVRQPKRSSKEGNTRVDFSFKINDQEVEFYYEILNKVWAIEQGRLNDAAASLALMVAMKTSDRLLIKGDVSPLLLEGLHAIQDIWLQWWPDRYHRVEIVANGSRQSIEPGQGAISSFTGGVDSFYTSITKKDELKKLFYVYGYDVPLGHQEFSGRLHNLIDNASKDVGIPLVEVRTNLRDSLADHIDWLHYHGAAVAAVGMLLSQEVGRLYIPSTRVYGDPTPLGSHPLTDRLWSTEYLRIENDGASMTRPGKIAMIYPNKVVRKHLRVCWQIQEKMNCGVCEKCVRTMAAIEAVGGLKPFRTFPRTVTDEQLSAPVGARYYQFIQETLDWISANDDKSEGKRVSRLLKKSLDDFKTVQVKEVVKNSVKDLANEDIVEVLDTIPMRRVVKVALDVFIRKAKRRI